MDLKTATLKLTDYFGISADGWHAKAILRALESVQSETRDATLREAADAVDNGIMRDNPAFTIRALIAEPAPPDPLLVALAGLFAAWWKRQEAALAFDTGIPISFEAICKSGLFGSTLRSWELTSLGKAAIALAEAGR